MSSVQVAARAQSALLLRSPVTWATMATTTPHPTQSESVTLLLLRTEPDLAEDKEETCIVEPGDQVLVKTYQKKTIDPSWSRPHTVLVMTHRLFE
ncbi:hypothetical protein AAFF_G00229260 [Aldrovandia affinis]|uniref:Uncharacterized protein n=1 Tax=Aldrovandia affinis TaxID=143900 RepID=A0AAD7SVN4_9TELE|nr:hypothetical protein AAFF_G00229260 [Aldrovandia affinis]